MTHSDDTARVSRIARGATALLVFPTTGNRGKEWRLTSTQADEWATAYPTLDVVAEARKALAWVKANEGHRKTATGMPKFLGRRRDVA